MNRKVCAAMMFLACSAVPAQDWTVTGELKAPPPERQKVTAGTVRIRFKDKPAEFSDEMELDPVTGNFRFTQLSDGVYEVVGIHPSRDSYLPGCKEVTLPPAPQPLSISLVKAELQPAALLKNQFFHDKRGKPMAHLKLRLVPPCHDWKDMTGYVETDSEGRVSIPALLVGPDHKTVTEILPSGSAAPAPRRQEEDSGTGPFEQTSQSSSNPSPEVLKGGGVIGKRSGIPLILPTDSLNPKGWTIDLANGTISPDVGLTASEKLRLHATRLIYPSSILLPAVVAVTNQARYDPVEWGQGGIALIQRFASAYGYNVALRNSMAFAIDSTLRLDPRYFPSTHSSTLGRLGDALLQTVITRTDSGGRTFNFWRFGSAYGAGFVSNAWYPPHAARPADAFIRGSTALGLDSIANVMREFSPAFTQGVGDDVRRQQERFRRECSSSNTWFECLGEILGGDPMRLTIGQIGPKSGMGFGGAFAIHSNFSEGWEITTSLTALATTNVSANGGIHVRAVRNPFVPIRVIKGSGPALALPDFRSSLELNFYTEATKLNQISYYGIGPQSSRTSPAFFSFREFITGGNVTYPLGRTGLAIYGEFNDRYVGLRTAGGPDSVFLRYSEESAPGLQHHPSFLQTGEGIKLRLSLRWLQFNYSGVYQQFAAVSDSKYSFQRVTADLRHDFPFYSKQMAQRQNHGPLRGGPMRSRGLYGNLNLRALWINSHTASGHAVPFYFQPTLGGLDANGNGALESYADYRFRGPNLLLFQGEIEHTILGPFHGVFRASEGQVASASRDLTKSLLGSYAAGFRIRAGGLPVFTFLFAWGGHEGTHNIAFLNPRLPQDPTPVSLF